MQDGECNRYPALSYKFALSYRKLVNAERKCVMAKNRIGRINEEIHREISNLIHSMKDPRISGNMVSVTGVNTTGDLRYCKVYVSALNKENEKDVIKALRSAGGWLRRELSASLKLRYTPELIIEPDDSIERGAHISKIINELEKGEEEDNA